MARPLVSSQIALESCFRGFLFFSAFVWFKRKRDCVFPFYANFPPFKVSVSRVTVNLNWQRFGFNSLPNDPSTRNTYVTLTVDLRNKLIHSS